MLSLVISLLATNHLLDARFNGESSGMFALFITLPAVVTTSALTAWWTSGLAAWFNYKEV
jgi:hypothetical protein